jgi:catechol 2,3-dioxygenase-like lactoylglutathione lyase family enzyme
MGTDAQLVLIILAVTDVDRSAAFYRQAFGWSQHVDEPVYAELELPGGMRLGLYERHGFGRNTGEVPTPVPKGAITGSELYVRVSDLAIAMRRLEDAGARALSPRAARPWGDEAAYYADPDGNVVVVATPLAPVTPQRHS